MKSGGLKIFILAILLMGAAAGFGWILFDKLSDKAGSGRDGRTSRPVPVEVAPIERGPITLERTYDIIGRVIDAGTMELTFLFKSGDFNVNAKAAIKWVLQDPNVHTVIAGCTTFDQLEEDLSILDDLTLSDHEKRDLQAASIVGGLYCQGCNQCLNGCRRSLPLPDLMRAYMYLYGYRNLGRAHDTLASVNLPEQPCDDCAVCTATCAAGFDLRDKVRDLARLRQTPREFLV